MATKLTMERRLREVLNNLGFADDELHLETTSTGRVGGYIVSHKFDRTPQDRRQADLWAHLEQQLSKAELRHIIALLTMAPAEVAEDRAA